MMYLYIWIKWNILKNDVFVYLDKMEYMKEGCICIFG